MEDIISYCKADIEATQEAYERISVTKDSDYSTIQHRNWLLRKLSYLKDMFLKFIGV